MVSGTANSDAPVAIVGAGLTGLSAALALQATGTGFRIYEKLAWAGGHAITVEEDGFRFDRTGHLLHLRHPELRERVLDWLGGDYLEVQRKSVIWSHGTYTRYPFQANTYGLPPEVAYECVMGFIEANARTPEHPPRNFEEYCLDTFGTGISRHFMIPYNSRLWGVAPTEITSDWCQRFVPEPKLSDVIAGAVGMNDRELGYNTNFVYPRLGIGELPKAMVRSLGRTTEQLALETGPTRIDAGARRLWVDGREHPYEVLINTAPLSVLLDLIDDLPDAVRAAQSKLRCTHLYYLDVALDVPAGQDVHWVYVPEARYPFYRLGCYSHFSPAMAPEGKAGLYIELADRSEPALDTLLPRVAEALVEMGWIARPEQIRFARVRRIDHAYVIFDHHYFDCVNTIFPFLEEHHIVSTGRYGGWNYSSMEDALSFGDKAAARARQQLT